MWLVQKLQIHCAQLQHLQLSIASFATQLETFSACKLCSFTNCQHPFAPFVPIIFWKVKALNFIQTHWFSIKCIIGFTLHQKVNHATNEQSLDCNFSLSKMPGHFCTTISISPVQDNSEQGLTENGQHSEEERIFPNTCQWHGKEIAGHTIASVCLELFVVAKLATMPWIGHEECNHFLFQHDILTVHFFNCKWRFFDASIAFCFCCNFVNIFAASLALFQFAWNLFCCKLHNAKNTLISLSFWNRLCSNIRNMSFH